MTQTTATIDTPDSTSPAGPAGDPRPAFFDAVSCGREVVRNITSDQLDNATPCASFDVRQLTGHLLGALHRIGVVGAGGDPFEFADLLEGKVDPDVVAIWDAEVAGVKRVWDDDAVLTTMVRLPWATLPGFVALSIYVNEVVVHTWDLAVATGQSPEWNPATVELAYETMRIGLPAEGRSDDFDQQPSDEAGNFLPPFKNVVTVSEDAPLIDRLVAWNGRRP